MKVSEKAVRTAVIILSLVGVSVLILISALSEVDDIELSDIGEYNGKTIRTRGIAVGQTIHSYGSSKILIVDRSGNTAEVFLERSDIRVKPGSLISVKGEVYAEGDSVSITLQSDSGLEVIEEMEPVGLDDGIGPWVRISMESVVVSISSKGWSRIDMTVHSDTSKDPLFKEIEVLEPDDDIRVGDLVLVDGLMWDDGVIMCYGSESIEVIYRPEPVTSSLLNLISSLSDSPSDIPRGKIDIVAYIKYEPGFGSLYVGDEATGSSISLKVIIPDGCEGLHMGDLIRLVNTTLFWDKDGLRYVLFPESIELISIHGHWALKLENLEYGISRYENAEVRLRGDIEQHYDGIYLISGDSRIELRSDGPVKTGQDREITGIVRYDPKSSSHYVEVPEDIP